MKGKLILTIIAIALIVACNKSRAESLKDHLKDKKLLFQGVCGINSKGELSDDPAKSVGSMPCEGSEISPDDDYMFFLLYQNGKPVRYIRVQISTKVQTVIWREADSMI